MKNSEEMVNSLLERRDKYDAAQKKKRTIFTRTVTSMCCLCLVALLGFGMWQGGVFNTTPPPARNQHSDTEGTNSNIKDFTLVVDSLATGELTEFAADMYRPKGYDEHIGSVLALKIEISNNITQKYPVIIYQYNNGVKVSLDKLLLEANSEKELLNSKNVIQVEAVNDIGTGYLYFSELNAEQIFALAESGIYCMYVGSGKTVAVEDNWWETVEGINTFAERYGDQYILNPNSDIQGIPDIFAE